MRLPLTDPDNPRSVDLEQFKRMVDLYLSRDFCYFDTAYPYHGEYSVDAVRQALVERYHRKSFLLADKMPILRVKAPEDYDRFFAEQQRRCGVRYFQGAVGTGPGEKEQDGVRHFSQHHEVQHGARSVYGEVGAVQKAPVDGLFWVIV